MNSPGSMIEVVNDFAMETPTNFSRAEQSLKPSFLATNIESIGRLLTNDPRPTETDSIDWDLVHSSIQKAFDVLAKRVAEEIPGAISVVGKCSGKAFSLFSYRVFPRLEKGDIDPVIVGVTCIDTGTEFRINGDISGEETGIVYFDEGCDRLVSASNQSVLSSASELAETLASQHEIIVQEIRDHRAASSRQ